MAGLVEDADGGSKHRRWTGLEKFLAIATAACALATAVLTLITTGVNSDRVQAGTDLANLQAQYNTLRTRDSQLESQNQQYRDQLAQQPSTTPPVSQTTQQSPQSAGGAQLGSYQFDLVSGREVPLGADPPTQAQVVAGNQGDIIWRADFGGEPLLPGTSETVVNLTDGTIPTYQACKSGEHVVTGVSQPVVGTAFCIIENTAVVAGVRVLALHTSSSPSFVTLQVTTWQNQTP
jgi:hypothetical protein